MTREYLDWSNVEECAKELAGNWRKFESFGWKHHSDADADRRCIVYTHNRDSGLIDQSNADTIDKELSRFPNTARSESHNHWAVGWIDGWSILVYRKDRRITKAFRKYCELRKRLADYPVLDETDYSNREYEATIEAIKNNRPSIEGDKSALPDDWPIHVYDWLNDNDDRQLENRDDQGAYPSEESIMLALVELFPKAVFPESLINLMDSETANMVPHFDADDRTPFIYRLNDADGSLVCAECVNSEIESYLNNPRMNSCPNIVGRELHVTGQPIKCAWCAELIQSSCGSNKEVKS